MPGSMGIAMGIAMGMAMRMGEPGARSPVVAA